MNHKLLLSLALLGPAAVVAQAQTRTVSGRVTAVADGTGLPGATVLEQGTTNGTSTDADGNFRLTVRQGATIVISSVGFATQTIPVGEQTNINVRLQGSEQLLNETVVVGYGTQTKRELTGAVTQLGSKEVENVPVVSFEQAVQGRTPGVQINQGSGKLGAAVQIRVRGSSSVSASNQPLYVIDGIPVTSQDVGLANTEPINPLADLNPNDIESITILKDAAASAIYGSRASNGVILVTTKKGRQGQTRVNVGYYYGRSEATRLRKFLNAEQYKELFAEAIRNSAANPDGYINFFYGPNPDIAEVFEFEGGLDYNSNFDTPWSELAFRKGNVQQYDANVSGGDAKTRFFLSANYNDQTGIIVGNRYRRGSFRTNLDHSITEKLKVGLNLSLTRSVNNRVPDDNAFSNPVQLNAIPPIQAKDDPTDPTGLNRGTLYYNALVEVSNAQNTAGTYRSFSNAFLQYQPISGLTLRSEIGADFLNLNEELFRGRYTEDGAPTGYGYSNQVQSINYTTNQTATYFKTIGNDHTVEALLGFSFQRFNQRQTASEGRGFPNDQFRRIASAARITAGSSSGTDYSFISYLSRVNYTFRNKYLVSASARVDGSSRFSPDNRYGIFPAGSVGWVITEEDFLQGNSAVSLLKLRASYGLTGNAEVGNFAYRRLFTAIPYADVAGIQPSGLGNPNLTWENTAQADIGLEFGFLNNRIGGEIDVYDKQTNDLLLDLQLPYTGGYPIVTRNIGKLQNRGIELSLNTRNIDNEVFKWATNFNISVNRNKVTQLNGQEIISGGRNLGRVREGEPIGVFWGKKFAGADPATGDALYYTAEGTTTNDYTAAADQRLGNPNPKFTGGLTNTFNAFGFDLSILNQFSYGNDIYNIGGVFQSVNADFFDNQTVDQLRRWRQPGDVTDVPRASFGDANGTQPSSRWIYDGSFLRFKNVTLGYTLPKSLIEKARLQSARIYVTGQNLITITDYPGYDPEVNTTAFGLPNYLLGHDFYTPPLAKTWLVGVNLGF
ncbi:SusC/RagA family TonB-linked outer membrane protein [Solirubrum puertoriconensis]|uniref:SusC/RagA family TonB-linked outer membrane protein n=1 Tax=Solirubrum puertoriconensis TaxID=1751427 RepID=A0A9X0HJ50_SOLP1|nr:TonB-dependent receptor [Solirubrum puertoriconensis]KUG06804.1 SusC/RagA family TonB-linked outer membrane protein [Solirubrum puertoriconensis]